MFLKFIVNCGFSSWLNQIGQLMAIYDLLLEVGYFLGHLNWIIMNEWMNEWKFLLAEIKNIKLNTNNNIKQFILQRCYQVTNNIYGNPKSLNSS